MSCPCNPAFFAPAGVYCPELWGTSTAPHPTGMASEVSVKWCTSENNKWVALSEHLRSGFQLGLTFLFFISPSISWQFMSMSAPRVQSYPPTAAM